MSSNELSRHTAGVYAIAPTPFTDDGAVDMVSFDRLIDFYVDAGVNGVTILGQLGEAQKLDQDEAIAVVRSVVRRSTLPVIVGASAPGFAAIRSLTVAGMDACAAGVMIAPRAHYAPTTRSSAITQVVSYYGGAADTI